jgi:hypothetical protein
MDRIGIPLFTVDLFIVVIALCLQVIMLSSFLISVRVKAVCCLVVTNLGPTNRQRAASF